MLQGSRSQIHSIRRRESLLKQYATAPTFGEGPDDDDASTLGIASAAYHAPNEAQRHRYGLRSCGGSFVWPFG
jgi:hypothetical protein